VRDDAHEQAGEAALFIARLAAPYRMTSSVYGYAYEDE